MADSGITEGIPVCRIYLALCGAKLTRSDLPDSMCPPECQREISYCLDCLYVANGQNIAAGLGLRAPGIYVPMSS